MIGEAAGHSWTKGHCAACNSSDIDLVKKEPIANVNHFTA